MTAEPVPTWDEDSALSFVGPFETHRVQLYGRRVPHLQAWPVSGGRVCVALDERYVVELSVEEAERVVPFIADCIAVAAGWTCHPRQGEEPRRAVPFPEEFGIAQMG